MTNPNLKIKQNDDNTIRIYTPYSAQFVSEIKSQIGGCRWDRDDKCWIAPESAINTVRQIMRSVYGASDDESAELVDVKITFRRNHGRLRSNFEFLGFTLASAYSRDSGAYAGVGVEFVKGYPHSGGSVKNWFTEIDAGSVAILRGVSKSAVERVLEEGNLSGNKYGLTERDYYDIDLEIIEGTEKLDKAALSKEKEELLKRLAEIEELLK